MSPILCRDPQLLEYRQTHIDDGSSAYSIHGINTTLVENVETPAAGSQPALAGCDDSHRVRKSRLKAAAGNIARPTALRLHKRRQAAPRAFAKLAVAQRVG